MVESIIAGTLIIILAIIAKIWMGREKKPVKEKDSGQLNQNTQAAAGGTQPGQQPVQQQPAAPAHGASTTHASASAHDGHSTRKSSPWFLNTIGVLVLIVFACIIGYWISSLVPKVKHFFADEPKKTYSITTPVFDPSKPYWKIPVKFGDEFESFEFIDGGNVNFFFFEATCDYCATDSEWSFGKDGICGLAGKDIILPPGRYYSNYWSFRASKHGQKGTLVIYCQRK